MAESKYGRQNKLADIRRVCEGAISMPFGDYIKFLEGSGHLTQDPVDETLAVTPSGRGDCQWWQSGGFDRSGRGALQTSATAAPRPRQRSSRPPQIIPSRTAASRRQSGRRALRSRSAAMGSGGIGTVYRATQLPSNARSHSKRFASSLRSFQTSSGRRFVGAFEMWSAPRPAWRIPTSCRFTTSTSIASIPMWSPSSVPAARCAGSSPTPNRFR